MNLPNPVLWQLLAAGGLGAIIALILLLKWDWVFRAWHASARLLHKGFLNVSWLMWNRRLARSINSAVACLTYDVPELRPKPVVLKRQRRAEEFIDEGDDCLILWVAGGRSRQEIVASTVLQYVSAAFLPQNRLYGDPDLIQAIDFTLAELLLLTMGQRQPLEILRRQLIAPTFQNSRLRLLKETLEALHQEGILMSILLRELLAMHTYWPETALLGPQIRQESFAFTLFLRQVMHDRSTVPRHYHGLYIKVSLYLLTEKDELSDNVLLNYQKHLRHNLEVQGRHSLYLIGYGRFGVAATRRLARWLLETGLAPSCQDRMLAHAFKPEGSGPVHLVLCLCRAELADRSTAVAYRELLRAALDFLPTQAIGHIAVETLARAPGIISIVVLCRSDADYQVALLTADVWEAYRRELENVLCEPVRLAWWHSHLRTYLLSLLGLDIMDVVSIELDPLQRTALVTVTDAMMRYRVLQPEKALIQLVDEVTGYDITLHSQARQKQEWNLAELTYYLALYLPDLLGAKIDLAGFVYDDQIMKVALDSLDSGDSHQDDQHQLALNDTLVEQFCQDAALQEVHFIKYREDPLESLAVFALYPLMPDSVQTVNWLETQQMLQVVVKDEYSCRVARGQENRNLYLAEKLVGCKLQVIYPTTPVG